MAHIKKRNARKFLERGSVEPSISNRTDEGLRFNMTIGEHIVSMTELERDNLIKSWFEMQHEFKR